MPIPFRCYPIALTLLLCVLVSSCAFTVPPDGGPRDTTPPTVLGTTPDMGTRSFTGTSITVRFSTYVDRAVTQAVSVLPTTRTRSTYAGNEITVEFLEPLAPNTTYSVTMGTSWSDVRGNRPATPYSLVFSTGADIDTGSIRVLVQGASFDNGVVFCQPITDDTSYQPRRNPARYRVPLGTTGECVIRGLANARYRLLVVRDANRNGLADPGEDLGTATRDAEIRNGGSDTVTMTLAPAPDRVPPSPVRARAQNARVITVAFTEAVDSSNLTVDAFRVTDSTGTAVPVDAVWTVADMREAIALRTAAPMLPGRYSLQIAPKVIRDSAGRAMADTTPAMTVMASATAYSARQRVRGVNIADSAKGIPTAARFTLLLEQPATAADINVRLRRDTTLIPVTVDVRGARIDVAPTADLAPATMYTLRVDLGGDTTIQRTVTTADRLDPGSFTGVVIDESGIAQRYLLRCFDGKKRLVRTLDVANADSVSVDALPPSAYTFDAVVDRNGNGVFDAGTDEPWTFGERLIPMRATVQIRPRWQVDGIRLVVPSAP